MAVEAAAEPRKGPYDQFILFGDSITEMSANQALGFSLMAALQNQYMRKLDVVNRGFSGYTTAHAILCLPKFYPSPAQAHVRIMLVFFGANDACLPGTNQHVPLEEYKANLKAIAQHPQVTAHKPTRLILMTPGPLNEWASHLTDLSNGFSQPRRTAEHTQKYANAVVQVGQEIGVPVIDLWSTIMTQAGWQPGEPLSGSKRVPENQYLKSIMIDGLHFNGKGYRVILEQLTQAIARHYPRQRPEALDNVFPPWLEAPR